MHLSMSIWNVLAFIYFTGYAYSVAGNYEATQQNLRYVKKHRPDLHERSVTLTGGKTMSRVVSIGFSVGAGFLWFLTVHQKRFWLLPLGLYTLSEKERDVLEKTFTDIDNDLNSD